MSGEERESELVDPELVKRVEASVNDEAEEMLLYGEVDPTQPPSGLRYSERRLWSDYANGDQRVLSVLARLSRMRARADVSDQPMPWRGEFSVCFIASRESAAQKLDLLGELLEQADFFEEGGSYGVMPEGDVIAGSPLDRRLTELRASLQTEKAPSTEKTR